MNLSRCPPVGQFLIYSDGGMNLQVRLDGQTVWLPQKLIAELFQVTVPTVNENLANSYDEGELSPESTIRKFRIVQTEGTRQVSRLVDHYNLDAILALPQPVDRHFAEALDELVRLTESPPPSTNAKKKPGRKKKDGH